MGPEVTRADLEDFERYDYRQNDKLMKKKQRMRTRNRTRNRKKEIVVSMEDKGPKNRLMVEDQNLQEIIESLEHGGQEEEKKGKREELELMRDQREIDELRRIEEEQIESKITTTTTTTNYDHHISNVQDNDKKEEEEEEDEYSSDYEEVFEADPSKSNVVVLVKKFVKDSDLQQWRNGIMCSVEPTFPGRLKKGHLAPEDLKTIAINETINLIEHEMKAVEKNQKSAINMMCRQKVFVGEEAVVWVTFQDHNNVPGLLLSEEQRSKYLLTIRRVGKEEKVTIPLLPCHTNRPPFLNNFDYEINWGIIRMSYHGVIPTHEFGVFELCVGQFSNRFVEIFPLPKPSSFPDEVVVFEAAKQDGKALQYASEELKNDKEVVLEAVKQYGKALQYASEELKNDKEVVLAAIRQEGRSLKYASSSLQEFFKENPPPPSIKMLLNNLNLQKNIPKFLEEGAEGAEDLYEYTVEELKEDFGLNTVTARKIFREIQKIKK